MINLLRALRDKVNSVSEQTRKNIRDGISKKEPKDTLGIKNIVTEVRLTLMGLLVN